MKKSLYSDWVSPLWPESFQKRIHVRHVLDVRCKRCNEPGEQVGFVDELGGNYCVFCELTTKEEMGIE